MSKKIVSIVAMMAMIVTMIVPVWAGGDNTGEDKFGCAIYVKKDNVQGEYKLGTPKEINLECWASNSAGKELKRVVSVSGSQVKAIEYKNGEKWSDISGFNQKIKLKNDINRVIRVTFSKEGKYTIYYKLNELNGKAFAESHLNIEIKNGEIKILDNNDIVKETTTPKTTTANVTTTKGDNNKETTVKIGKTKITKVKKSRKSAKITFKKIKKVSGYQLQLSTSSKFKGKKVVKTTKSVKYTFKKLKSNKKYYVRVRGFVKKNKTTNYGNWTSAKFKTLK